MSSDEHNQVQHIGADDTDLQPGQQVGEYVVDDKIGEGGFGTVFKATHPVIGKEVALKVLNRQYSAQPEMLSRFVAEARAVNQIRHRHIIDIFGFGQLEDGRHYYVMEYLSGMPLDEYLTDCGRISLTETIPMLRSVARALDAAHAKGIAHRDLKPENIYLAHDNDGSLFPKLLDFGIAKLLTAGSPQSHKTRTGAPMGTPMYMSPEQCRGRDVDHRTDIYAFGIVTYQMLTGEVPFDGEDYMEILLKQISEEAPPPTSINPELPASVDNALAWMLNKDPAERPPNLVTAVRSLEEAAESAGIPYLAAPEPTGVYSASTSSVVSQKTPAVVQSIPATGPGDAPSAPTANASAAIAPSARGKSRLLMFGGAIVAACVAGVVAFAVISGSKGDDKPAPSQPPVVKQQPAVLPPPEPTPRPALTPPPQPVPASDSLVTISIAGAPDGTEVFGPRGPLGVAPGDVQLKKGTSKVILTFRHDEYRTTTKTVRPKADQSVTIRMKKRKRGGKRIRPIRGKDGKAGKDGKDGRDRRNTIEDPFARKKK